MNLGYHSAAHLLLLRLLVAGRLPLYEGEGLRLDGRFGAEDLVLYLRGHVLEGFADVLILLRAHLEVLHSELLG